MKMGIQGRVKSFMTGHKFVPICYYIRKFYLERDILKNPISKYEPAGKYPLLPVNDNKHISRRVLGDKPIFDSNGIPMAKYGERMYYNIVRVAQYGLMQANFGDIRTASICASWLLDNCVEGRIPYHIDYHILKPHLCIEAPFVSSMAQGQTLSLVCRVYRDLGLDAEYVKKICYKIVETIEKPVSEGGTSTTLFGTKFYEEYATDPGTHVLNGFIFALIGLYDCWKVFNSKEAELAFAEGYDSLIMRLPLYDTDSISLYNLGHIEYPCNDTCSSIPYHIIHIKQLELMEAIKPNKVIEFYIQKWKSQCRNSI